MKLYIIFTFSKQNKNMENKQDRITDMDLYNKKYDITVLEKNMDHLNPKTILYTQYLNVNFCAKLYHLNSVDIDSGSEDSYIWDVPYIIRRQPHINKEELCNEITRIENNLKS